VDNEQPQLDKEGRASVIIGGREIYKWKQTLDEVIMSIPKPPNVPGNAIICNISPKHLVVGIKGNDRNYIDEGLGGSVVVRIRQNITSNSVSKSSMNTHIHSFIHYTGR
jgi:hypothetical protein